MPLNLPIIEIGRCCWIYLVGHCADRLIWYVLLRPFLVCCMEFHIQFNLPNVALHLQWNLRWTPNNHLRWNSYVGIYVAWFWGVYVEISTLKLTFGKDFNVNPPPYVEFYVE